MATSAQLLAKVDAAIEALLTGQHESYSLGDRTVTRLDLDSLMKQRAVLARWASRESTGMARVARVNRISK